MMSPKSLFLTTTALAMLGSSAFADLSPRDAWSDWQGYFSSMGYELKATETADGESINLSDISVHMQIPDDGGSVDISMPKMALVDAGNGTVEIQWPATLPIKFAGEIDGEAFSAVLNYVTEDLSFVASGDPGNVTYDYSALSSLMTVADIVADGKSVGNNLLSFMIKTGAMEGTSTFVSGGKYDLAQTQKIQDVSYEIGFADPDSSAAGTFSGNVKNMAFSSKTHIPGGINLDDISAALKAGLSGEFSLAMTGSSSAFSATEDDETTNVTSSSEKATLNVALSGQSIAYDADATGYKMDMVGGEIPLPINVEMGTIGANLLIPVEKSDELSDFGFGMTLGDVTLSEMIWMMADPGKVLPRDPATISLDLIGKTKLLVDLTNEKELKAFEDRDEVPAELHALTLKNLLVSFGGAELTGDGDATFDNSDLESFDGMPRPTGKVNLKLVGGNGLMDKLVEMGLLSSEDVMGARMMMGLFARPGEGEDTLKSTLEINDQGHVLANGQRIQ